MTQNACPANAKVSEGSKPLFISLWLVFRLGRTKWTDVGGSLDLLEDQREILVEFGVNPMESREENS